MTADPIDIVEEILRRNGYDVNLRDNEVDRYFLFDLIADPIDLNLAWSQFPAHQEIRARATQVDAVSDIVPVWGYRTPKNDNRCSESELINSVRRHIAAMHPLILRTDYNDLVLKFLERPFDVHVVADETKVPLSNERNALVGALYEAIGEFTLQHFSFEPPVKSVLYDWAIFLTKCDEVAMYLLWPVLDEIGGVDPETPLPGFELWRCDCRSNYWIKDNDFQSGVVNVLPPWNRNIAT